MSKPRLADTLEVPAAETTTLDQVSPMITREQVADAIITASTAAGVSCTARDAERLIALFETARDVIAERGRGGGGVYLLPESFLRSNAYRVMEAIVPDGVEALPGDPTVLGQLNELFLNGPDVVGGFQHTVAVHGMRDFCGVSIATRRVDV